MLRSAFNRRALARSSRMPSDAESSIKILELVRRPAAMLSLFQSSSGKRPVRTACASTFASAQSKRMTSCCVDISSEKIPTPVGLSLCIAALRARESANAVLPELGRPAMMIRSELCHPPVRVSRSRKPVGTPVTPLCFP